MTPIKRVKSPGDRSRCAFDTMAAGSRIDRLYNSAIQKDES